MDDEVKAKLLQYVEKMEAAAGKGADFLAEQAPETVRQFLLWGFWKHAIAASVCVAFSVALAFAARRLFRWARLRANETCDDFYLVAPIGTGATSAFLFCPALYHGFSALKIAIAPNVYILETISQLVK